MTKRNFAAGEVLTAANVNTYLSGSRNFIINGGMDIWQRGTSVTPATGEGYTADRWATFSYASSSATISRQDLAPGTIDGFDGAYFLRMNATNTKSYLTQKVEDVRKLAGQVATISFWAKSASAQTVTSEMYQLFGTGGSTPVGPFGAGSFAVTTSWARYSISVTIPSVAGKTIGAGSSLQLLIYGAINNALDITGVQLEEGYTATPFYRNANSIQGELAACQRYYYRIDTGAYIPGYQRYSNDTYRWVLINIPVSMRSVIVSGDVTATFSTSPALAFYNATSSTITFGSDSGSTTGYPAVLDSLSVNKEL